MRKLAARQGVASRALAFAILTAARSGEVRGMQWAELDVVTGVLDDSSVADEGGEGTSLPLSSQALALLGEPGQADDLVFPGERTGKPLSDMSLTAVLRRMGRSETVHGFRSTFRDWAGESSSFPREVIEAALAHRLKDKAEAAYARGDLFTKRRALMEEWAGVVSTGV